MEGHWWGEGDTEWRDIGGVRGHRMEGHWLGEWDTEWKDIGGVRGTQNGRTLVG